MSWTWPKPGPKQPTSVPEPNKLTSEPNKPSLKTNNDNHGKSKKNSGTTKHSSRNTNNNPKARRNVKRQYNSNNNPKTETARFAKPHESAVIRNEQAQTKREMLPNTSNKRQASIALGAVLVGVSAVLLSVLDKKCKS